MTPPHGRVRRASAEDIDAIIDIFLARSGANPARDAPQRGAYREELLARIQSTDPSFGFWVYESAEGVIGWIANQRCRTSPSVGRTMAEMSAYLAPIARGRGVGAALVREAMDAAIDTEIECIVAYAGDDNPAAAAILERQGFTRAGTIPKPHKTPSRPTIGVYLWLVPSERALGSPER